MDDLVMIDLEGMIAEGRAPDEDVLSLREQLASRRGHSERRSALLAKRYGARQLKPRDLASLHDAVGGTYRAAESLVTAAARTILELQAEASDPAAFAAYEDALDVLVGQLSPREWCMSGR